MQEKRADHQRSVPDSVCHEARKNDDHAKARQTAAGDLPQLRHREPKLVRPLHKDSAADAKADTLSKDRHETGPKKTVGMDVWGYGGGGRCAFVCLTLWHGENKT